MLGGLVGVGLGLASPFAVRRGVVRAQGTPQPPIASVRPETMVYGGVEITDPYAWLEDPDDPEVIAYLEAENAYREAVMAPTAAFQNALYEELLGRIQETDVSVPIPLDDWFYYVRTVEGLQYEIFARKQGSLAAPEEVLFDLNAMLRTDYISLLGAAPSPDHRYVAYLVNETGGDEGLLRIRDTATGADLPDEVSPVAAFAWANDNSTLLYVRQEEETLRASALYRHTVGADQTDDPLLYAEEDEAFELFLSTAKDRSYIFVRSFSYETAETRYLPADNPGGELTLFAPRREGIQYSLEHHGDEFLILTNEEAENFKVMATPVPNPDPATWRELVPHRADALIESWDVLAGHLALYGRQDALAQVWVRAMDSGELTRLTFDEAIYDVWPGTNWEYDTSKLRIEYTSYVTPISVYDVDLLTGERTLLKQEPVRGGHDPAAYVSAMLWATAPDGTEVPVSLVRGRDGGDGPRPTVLHGYGAYAYPAYIYFDSNLLSLLDRGVTYAQAHVRGGADLGREWYEDGKLLNKKNTFTDYIASAEHLIAAGETAADRLIGWGISAGGLLIANVVNERPDLFAGILAEVPWTDVVRTMLDPTIPLVTAEYTEWGDPSDPEVREYMRSYSPYDNIAAQDYPPMLVTAGLEDDRVMYWDPAKWVAKLRATKTDDNLLLLRMNMGAGHSGESGRYDYLREIAHDITFMLMVLGLAEADTPDTAAIAPRAKVSAEVRRHMASAWLARRIEVGRTVRALGRVRGEKASLPRHESRAMARALTRTS
jgi:oligopeptidase B